jgi:hypothetical protein
MHMISPSQTLEALLRQNAVKYRADERPLGALLASALNETAADGGMAAMLFGINNDTVFEDGSNGQPDVMGWSRGGNEGKRANALIEVKNAKAAFNWSGGVSQLERYQTRFPDIPRERRWLVLPEQRLQHILNKPGVNVPVDDLKHWNVLTWEDIGVWLTEHHPATDIAEAAAAVVMVALRAVQPAAEAEPASPVSGGAPA